MKLTDIIKTVAVIAVFIVIGTSQSIAGNKNKYVHNDTMSDGRVISREIFKHTDDGKYLTYYQKYDYEYDSNNRIVSKIVSKWNADEKCWQKVSLYKSTYENETCCIDFFLYKNGEFEKSERYIYTIGSDQYASAAQRFKWDDKSNKWILSNLNDLG